MTNTITANEIANTTSARQARSFEGVSRTTGLKVPLNLIFEESGFNARMDSLENARHVEDMALSFSKGDEPETLEVVPVILEDGRKMFKLVDGHCNFKAVKMANEKYGTNYESLVVDAKDMTTLEQRVRVLTSNNQKKLNNIERGKIYTDLIELEGMKQKEVAERLGVSVAQVSNAIQAHNMPESLKALVADGIISDSEALAKYRSEIKSDNLLDTNANADAYAQEVTKISASRVAKGEGKRVTVSAINNKGETPKKPKVAFTREVKANVVEAMEVVNSALEGFEEGEGATVELSAEQVAVLRKAGLDF